LERAKYAKSTRIFDFGKLRGREDNLLYKISEGFNLDEDDKTYFDVYMKDFID